METLNRRNALRLFGALAATTAIGTTPAFMTSASGIVGRISIGLDKAAYVVGDSMTLTVTEDLVSPRRIAVSDSSGAVWRKISDNGARQVWTATAARATNAVVTCTMTRSSDAAVFVDRASYQVTTLATGLTRIGMSAPTDLWAQRVAEVGAGLTARRIFADLANGADDKIRIIEQAHAAGMMPVISYKVGGDAAGAAAGRFNAVAEQAASRLASYGLPTTVSFWHEPNPDLSGSQYVAASKQILPLFKRGRVKVGPILNGWLLDRNLPTLAPYCPDEMFGIWDWFGIDTYHSSPDGIMPGERIPKLVSFLNGRGFTSIPLGVGEYNGYTAEAIASSGEVFLAEKRVRFACVWNSSAANFIPLAGDRLTAFKRTLADPRAMDPA
jgi:hypothetical protein